MGKNFFKAEIRKFVNFIIKVAFKAFIILSGFSIAIIICGLTETLLGLLIGFLVYWLEAVTIKYYLVSKYARRRDISFEKALDRYENDYNYNLMEFFYDFIFNYNIDNI